MTRPFATGQARGLGALALSLVIVAAGAAASGSATHRSAVHPATHQAAPAAPAVLAAPAGPATSVSPTPPPPAVPQLPHDVVAPAPPTAFEISGPAFDIKATVCQMPYVRPLDPPGEQRHTVCWVRDTFGVAPGSSSGGTSYILGHSWAEAQLVFNPLSVLVEAQVNRQAPVMQGEAATYPVTAINGYRITLQTATGTLTYLVSDAYAVRKNDAGAVPALMAADTPDRVVIITCGVLNGVDVDDNIIVDAYLESSTAAGPPAAQQ